MGLGERVRDGGSNLYRYETEVWYVHAGVGGSKQVGTPLLPILGMCECTQPILCHSVLL